MDSLLTVVFFVQRVRSIGSSTAFIFKFLCFHVGSLLLNLRSWLKSSFYEFVTFDFSLSCPTCFFILSSVTYHGLLLLCSVLFRSLFSFFNICFIPYRSTSFHSHLSSL